MTRTFTLTVDMDSALFGGAPETELGYVLRDIIERVKDQGTETFVVKARRPRQSRRSWAAVDSQGNTVGEFRILERD